jgi:hypothetical protein
MSHRSVRRLLAYLVFVMVGLVQSTASFAQQNFFNVPSSEITPKGTVFFQQQFNALSGLLSSNTTACYGFGGGFECGVNLLGITYNEKQKTFVSSARGEYPVYPSVGVNMQQRVFVRGGYSFSVGGQLLTSRSPSNLEVYGYANNRWQHNRLKVVCGIFWGNVSYFGRASFLVKNTILPGVQLGFEHQIIKETLFFQADFLSGRTPYSNLILGLAYKCAEHIILSAGYQIPNDRTTSSPAAIVEFTWAP